MWSEEAFVFGIPYIEPIRILRLYNLGVRQENEKPFQSGYYKYPDRGVVPRWGYHFTGYPDWAVQPDSFYKYPDRGGSA
jgi:hypothetical protein